MKIKANLHFHSADDPRHSKTIAYDTREGIDRAASLGFGALALTYHHTFAWTQEHSDYAFEKGILLLSGIELYVREKMGRWGKHVIVLHCTKDVEDVRTFEDLEQYKKEHPESFILAPHPYHYGHFSLKGYLEKYIGLFDGVEHSWYYSQWFNRNKKAQKIAEKYNLPFIATSDTHFLKYLDKDYVEINIEEKTPKAFFAALRAGAFKNTSPQKHFWNDMVYTHGKFLLYEALKQGFKNPYNTYNK